MLKATTDALDTTLAADDEEALPPPALSSATPLLSDHMRDLIADRHRWQRARITLLNRVFGRCLWAAAGKKKLAQALHKAIREGFRRYVLEAREQLAAEAGSPRKPRRRKALDATWPQLVERHPMLCHQVEPLLLAMEPLLDFEEEAERQILAMIRAEPLPYADWAARMPGLGPLSLALLLAETGDPAGYATPDKLWKRMGLGLIEVADKAGGSRWIADRRIAKTMTGYNPRRRALMYVIGENMMKAMGKPEPGAEVHPIRALYDRAKAKYAARAAAEIAALKAAGCTAKQIADTIKDATGHRRALRVIEKELLRQLWREARRAKTVLSDSSNRAMPPPPATPVPPGDVASGHVSDSSKITLPPPAEPRRPARRRAA